MAQLPGFEAIEEPKEDKEVLPSTSEEGPKIAKFTREDLNRNLMKKEAQDILKLNSLRASLLDKVPLRSPLDLKISLYVCNFEYKFKKTKSLCLSLSVVLYSFSRHCL